MTWRGWFTVLALAVGVTFWCVFGYVAWHFVAKYW